MEWMGVILRRYIDFHVINYYLSLLLLYLLFLAVASLLFCSFFKMFFVLVLVLFGNLWGENRIEVEGVHYIETQCGQHMC